jgi:RimJ/RimL family protein N-acetyltransferase
MRTLPTEIGGASFSLCHMIPTRDIAAVLYDVFIKDSDNMRFWLRGEKVKSVDVVFDGIKRAYDCDNMYMYYILKDGHIIGEIGFASVVDKEQYTYVDYWLSPNVRGHQIIDKLLPIIESLAFNVLKKDGVLLGIDVDNIASRRVAERNGYVLKEILPASKKWVDGSFHDDCKYLKLKSEWSKEKQNA